MSINETLKKKIDEFDIDRHLDRLVEQAQSALATAQVKAGEAAVKYGDDVERVVGKVTGVIDERTDGRFATQITRVRDQVSTGVTRLAESRDDEV